MAERFASVLTEIVNGTVARDVMFVVTPLEGEQVAWIFPAGSTPTKIICVPVVAGVKSGREARLWLKIWLQVRLDEYAAHLAVERSSFALAIDDRGRPAVRIEYDRDRGNEPDDPTPAQHRRSAAHVQIHGSSEELAYVHALYGKGPPRVLSDYHFPVGGRRFRPSLEDFIEFLWSERLIPGVHQGWHEVLAKHRRDFLEVQLRAAIRRDPNTAADHLRQLGFDVRSPGALER